MPSTEFKFLASRINNDSLAYGIDNRVGWWKLNEGVELLLPIMMTLEQIILYQYKIHQVPIGSIHSA